VPRTGHWALSGVIQRMALKQMQTAGALCMNNIETHHGLTNHMKAALKVASKQSLKVYATTVSKPTRRQGIRFVTTGVTM
jgi:hypothetical protein